MQGYQFFLRDVRFCKAAFAIFNEYYCEYFSPFAYEWEISRVRMLLLAISHSNSLWLTGLLKCKSASRGVTNVDTVVAQRPLYVQLHLHQGSDTTLWTNSVEYHVASLPYHKITLSAFADWVRNASFFRILKPGTLRRKTPKFHNWLGDVEPPSLPSLIHEPLILTHLSSSPITGLAPSLLHMPHAFLWSMQVLFNQITLKRQGVTQKKFVLPLQSNPVWTLAHPMSKLQALKRKKEWFLWMNSHWTSRKNIFSPHQTPGPSPSSSPPTWSRPWQD